MLSYFLIEQMPERATTVVLNKKVVLRIFTKFTGKHPCRSLFNKAAGPTILKKTLAQAFSCEFFYRTPLDDCFLIANAPICCSD